MSLICLVSAHGSPGVTTTALALAGAWPQHRRVLLVEADPFGGMVAARFGLKDTPGLVSLAAAARQGLDAGVVWGHAQQLPGGLPVLVGAQSADQAHAVLGDLAAALAGWTASVGVDVIVDCGRIGPGSPVLGLLHRADMVLLLSRPTADQLRLAAHRANTLEVSEGRVRLLLVGEAPYGPGEVASVLGVEVARTVAWDPQTAAALAGVGVLNLRRSLLVRSAASLAENLLSELSGSTADEFHTLPSSSAVEVGGEV